MTYDRSTMRGHGKGNRQLFTDFCDAITRTSKESWRWESSDQMRKVTVFILLASKVVERAAVTSHGCFQGLKNVVKVFVKMQFKVFKGNYISLQH